MRTNATAYVHGFVSKGPGGESAIPQKGKLKNSNFAVVGLQPTPGRSVLLGFSCRGAGSEAYWPLGARGIATDHYPIKEGMIIIIIVADILDALMIH